MDSILIGGGVVVRGDALSVRFARSSGPGGQNVNKVASKVDLRVDLSRIDGLTDAARVRLDHATCRRRDAQGRLVVVSQRSRDQYRNMQDARERVRALVAAALRPPRSRRPTSPTASAREARLTAKRRTAERKKRRQRSGGDD